MWPSTCARCAQENRLGWLQRHGLFLCGACHDSADVDAPSPAAVKAERLAALERPVVKQERTDVGRTAQVSLLSPEPSRSRSRELPVVKQERTDDGQPAQVNLLSPEVSPEPSRSPSPVPTPARSKRRGSVTHAETVGPWPAWRDAVAALEHTEPPELTLMHKSGTQRRYKAYRSKVTTTVFVNTRNAHVQGGEQANMLRAALKAALARKRGH